MKDLIRIKFVPILIFFGIIIGFNNIEIANAANETIIKGWVKAGNLTVDDKVYNFVLNDDPKYVVMEFGNTFLKVYATYCDNKDYIYLCVDDVQFNRTDPATKIRYYKAYVTVTRQIAELSATRTATVTEGAVGDSFEIITTFQNIGQRKAENVSFFEKIPNSFSIDLNKLSCNVNLDSNTIFWAGDLSVNQKGECKYSVTANDAGTLKLESNITYNNGVANKTITFPSISLNVKNGSLEIQRSVSHNQVEVSGIFILNASVINVLASEAPDVLFKVEVPKEFRILNKTYGFDKDGNTVSFRSTLEKGSRIDLSLALMPLSSGNFSIPIKASYFSSGKDIVFINRVNVSSTAKPLDVVYIPNAYRFSSGQNISLSIELKSNTDKYYYKNIEASLSSDIPTFKDIHRNFEQQPSNYSTLTIFNDSFIAPNLVQNTTFNITLNIKYETEFDQKMSILKNYEVSVAEAYKVPEEKSFSVPLESLKSEKSNISSTGMKLEEKREQIGVFAAMRKAFASFKNVFIIIVTIVSVIVLFIYLRRKRGKGNAQPPTME